MYVLSSTFSTPLQNEQGWNSYTSKVNKALAILYPLKTICPEHKREGRGRG